jgi:hypothetical protein
MEDESQYDIFERRPDGTLYWVDAVDSLTEAKSRLRRLADTSANEYRVYNLLTREVVLNAPSSILNSHHGTQK